jgi:hypothetical protein
MKQATLMKFVAGLIVAICASGIIVCVWTLDKILMHLATN